jgi:hypothetical protein
MVANSAFTTQATKTTALGTQVSALSAAKVAHLTGPPERGVE